MSTLPAIRMVTFRHPFQLPGMDRPHAPGRFEVRSEREQLDVMWDAYRSITTIMLTDGLLQQSWVVSASDLDKALAEDAAQHRA